MKIILVDDDAFLRDMYVTKFTEAGDEVQVAENGEDALSKLGDAAYDVMLMDMVMPGMSGVDLIKKVKKSGNDSIKCIVLSNQGEEKDMNAAEAVGADGYIIKAELIPSEVVNKVHELVQ